MLCLGRHMILTTELPAISSPPVPVMRPEPRSSAASPVWPDAPPGVGPSFLLCPS
jgi:hypothetical protein